MNQTEATHLIRDLFEQPFDEARFTRFVRELLNEIDESKATRPIAGQYIPLSFRDHVQQYRRLATYTDPDGQAVDILLVQLKKATGLERARTVQRNFVAHHLKNRDGKDAALVAYYGEDRSDWRFSLVRMDYRLRIDDDSGKVRVEEDLTPARRFSFLVGQQEPNHTAQQQLFPILADDRRNPTLADLEAAFNIETVTREFFGRYKELFLQTRDELDDIASRDRRVRAEFQARGIDSDTFAKKLLGQIVFLYFLQKKGWLGVATGASWGSGPRGFLRQLYDGGPASYDSFFNDLLEPLFYEALAVERPDNFYRRLGCRIPFLNGGLFEPVGNYDWDGCPIPLSNALFGAIFDTFDLYNFTVWEDEPLEKEVAVDPEMLGKVFENLLEVGDRKSKGAFYTPREIVHYMCQEALIHYLDAALNLRPQGLDTAAPTRPTGQGLLLGSPPPRQRSLPAAERVYDPRVPREEIERFIRQGELAVEHETARAEGASSYKRRLPQSVAEHAQALDDALAGVKVCDPAIGSGAFPVGVMQEIVRGRLVLNAYLGDDAGRTAYAFKRHAIQESIYGVDIDPGAVDIAKLRLWLSLVVDEEDYHSIKPLPNLGYKIVCGNSLLSVPKDLFNQHLFARIEELKEEYFVETDRAAKQRQHGEIDALIGQLTQARGQFDYEVYFSEVFSTRGGFDVIIGNPPYVSHDRIEDKQLLKSRFEAYQPFADLYCYFAEVGLRLQGRHGTLCFITSNSYLKADYGRPLRKLISQKNDVLQLINVEDYQVFDSAIVNSAILLAQKMPSGYTPDCCVVNSPFSGDQLFTRFVESNRFYLPQSEFGADAWTLMPLHTLSLVRKIEARGRTLEQLKCKIRLGLATGANHAFLIDEEKRRELLDKDPANAAIIKPILRGRDIFRYGYQRSGLHMLLTRNGINVKRDFPTIYEHLDSFGDEFKKRGAQGQHWTNLRACAFFDDFKREKIIWIELTDRGRFALCTDEVYLVNSAYFLIPPPQFDSRYLLAVLNSSVIQFYMNQIAETSGMGVNRWINHFVKRFPIPQIPSTQQAPIANGVSQILRLTRDSGYPDDPGAQTQVAEIEHELNALVYELYGLTEDEIAIVEGRA